MASGVMQMIVAPILVGTSGGIAIGTLTGVSSAPMVAALIASIFSAIPVGAVVIRHSKGRVSISTSPEPYFDVQTSFLTVSFLLTLLIGVAAGVYIKKQNWLFGNPYAIEMGDLKAVGFTDTEAKKLLQARLEKDPHVPRRPEVLFAAAATGSVLCQQQPSERSKNVEDLVPLFAEQSAVVKESLKGFVALLYRELSTNPTAKHAIGIAHLDALWTLICK